LDLIEVARMPIRQLLNLLWSKFKYGFEKKGKNKSKPLELKEIWFKVFIGKGDFQHKILRVKEFLNKKHPVKITIKGKGRITREHFFNLLTKIRETLATEIGEQTEEPKFDGRNLTLILKSVKK
jgi:translation initiation factor IF-3